MYVEANHRLRMLNVTMLAFSSIVPVLVYSPWMHIGNPATDTLFVFFHIQRHLNTDTFEQEYIHPKFNGVAFESSDIVAYGVR